MFARAYITYPVTADASAAIIASFTFTIANFNAVACETNSGVAVLGQLNAAATTMSLLNATTGAAVTNLQMSGKILIFSAVYTV